MGTTAEKIEYLNETKELIKQSLNDLGADIEDSNSFRSYVQKINTLYEDWPKITEEGTFLSLNSTQKGKMKIELKGNTLQDGEPTPTNPVNINVVSGSNVIYTNNKNFIQLSNFTTTVNGMTIKFENDKIILNGTTTSNTDILLTNSNWNSFSTEMLSKINKYNEKICASNNSSLVTYFVTNQGEYLTQNITLSNAVKLVSIFIRIPSGKTYNNKDIEAQIEISSNPTTYETHQGKELPLDLPVENLLNPIAASQTLGSGGIMTKNNDNTYTLSDGRTDYADLVIIGTIDVVEGKTYYLFDNVIGNTNNNLSIRRGSTMLVSTNGVKIIGYTATATETLNIYIRYQDTSIRIYSPMVSTQIVTAYTPYGVTPIELCKIGDYQDYFYRDNGKWYLHKEIKKHIVDGSEVTEIAGNSFNEMYANGNIARAFIINDMHIASSRAETMSNTFNVVSGTVLWNGVLVGIQCYLNANKIAISTPINNIESFLGEALTVNNYTNAYIQYLVSIGTYFYYISPTDIEITDTTLINQLEAIYNAMSYKEQTNISQENNNLPFILNVSALQKE